MKSYNSINIMLLEAFNSILKFWLKPANRCSYYMQVSCLAQFLSFVKMHLFYSISGLDISYNSIYKGKRPILGLFIIKHSPSLLVFYLAHKHNTGTQEDGSRVSFPIKLFTNPIFLQHYYKKYLLCLPFLILWKRRHA